MTADEVKAILGLVPHPREGGWYVRSWQSEESLSAAAFPNSRYTGERWTGTAIYYLLEPDTFSELHRLRSDEIFHHYLGDAVEQLQLLPDGSGRTIVLGGDLLGGQRPQVIVPRGVWQGARLVAGGSWALLGCTVVPGFDYEDYEAASREQVTARWPEWRERITALTRE